LSPVGSTFGSVTGQASIAASVNGAAVGKRVGAFVGAGASGRGVVSVGAAVERWVGVSDGAGASRRGGVCAQAARQMANPTSSGKLERIAIAPRKANLFHLYYNAGFDRVPCDRVRRRIEND
jgi:hypothetical protein